MRRAERAALARDPPAAIVEHATRFLRSLEARGITVSRFHPLPLVADASAHSRLESDLRLVFDAACAITDRVFGASAARHADYLRLNRLQRQFAEFPRARREDLIARPDLMIGDGGKPRLLELNAGSGVGFLPEAHLYARYLHGFAGQAGGTVLDPLPAFSALLGRAGDSVVYLDSAPAAPDRVRSALNKLWILEATRNVRRVDSPGRHASVFLGFSTYQLEDRVQRGERALLDMLRRNASRIILPPSTVLQENKLNLAILSDPAWRRFFSREEREAVERILPWTRLLDARLAKDVAANPGRYVLKRAADRGGNSFIACGGLSSRDLAARLAFAVEDGNWVCQAFEAPRSFASATADAYGRVQHCDCHAILRAIIVGERVEGMHLSTSQQRVEDLVQARGWSSLAVAADLALSPLRPRPPRQLH